MCCSFEEFDGPMLEELVKLKKEVPDIFYKKLPKDISMTDIVKISVAIRQLQGPRSRCESEGEFRPLLKRGTQKRRFSVQFWWPDVIKFITQNLNWTVSTYWVYGGPQVTIFLQTSSHHNNTTNTSQSQHNYKSKLNTELYIFCCTCRQSSLW